MAADRQRVVVALSGGVDSTVAAALLCEDSSLEVIGVTLRFWPCEPGEEPDGSARSCCGIDGVGAARDSAATLGIPHYVLDCRDVFEREVLRPAWRDYASGRTPNPCVRCNGHIKFGILLDHARSLGATRVATGHHARIDHDAHGTPTLLRGRDAWKDQTYFLFSLTQEQLAATLFPVGGLTKSQVRDHARHLGLPNAERAESQDACLGGGDTSFAEALRLRFDEPARPGPLVDEAGKVLALHQGIHHFTIGQRRGLGVATGRKAYVAAIEPEDNRVVICHDQVRLMAPGLVASDMHWLVAPVPDFEAEVQIRYQHRAVRAQVTLEDGGHRVQVTFAEPQRAVTAGQAVVLYDGERVLGGGWIERQGGHT